MASFFDRPIKEDIATHPQFAFGGESIQILVAEEGQSNRLETEDSIAVRLIASPSRLAVVITRMLCAD